MLRRFVITVCAIAAAACAHAKAAEDRGAEVSRLYREVLPRVMPLDLKGIGVAYRHEIAALPNDRRVPDVAFVVQRDRAGTFDFGPAHASFAEAIDQPILDQIEALPRYLSAGEVAAQLRIARYDFTENSCPAIANILDTAAKSQHAAGSWNDEVWHPVAIDAEIRTASGRMTIRCSGQCFGISQWAVGAYSILKACAATR